MLTVRNHLATDRSRALSASYGMPGLNTLGMSSGFSTYLSTQTSVTVQGNNLYLNQRLDCLHKTIEKVQAGLDLTTVNSKARNAGVKLAWLYESEDVKMGGHGSSEGGWTETEMQKMAERVEKHLGGVEGAEGHHQKNAAAHPEHQADPNNIKFFRTRDLHKEIGHRGDWKNETDDPFIDKDQMLKDTTKNNNLKAELANVKIVIYMAAGTGFLLGAAVTLAMEGISLKKIKRAVIQGGKQAVKSTALSLVGYGIGRVVGERITNSVLNLLVRMGIQVSPKLTPLLNQTISGAVVSAIFLSIAYVRMRMSGLSVRRALRQIGPIAAMSIVGLTLSIVATYFFGKAGGIVFGLLWTAGQVLFVKSKDDHRKQLYKRLEYFRIENSMPIYVEGTVV